MEGPPQSPCKVWWGSDNPRRQGAGQSSFFVCHVFVGAGGVLEIYWFVNATSP